MQPKTFHMLNYLLLMTKSKSLSNERQNIRKESLKKSKDKLEFTLVVLELLQYLEVYFKL